MKHIAVREKMQRTLESIFATHYLVTDLMKFRYSKHMKPGQIGSTV